MTLHVDGGGREGYEKPVILVNTEKEHKDFPVFAMDLIAAFMVREAGAVAGR
jgi:hypothetical protein